MSEITPHHADDCLCSDCACIKEIVAPKETTAEVVGVVENLAPDPEAVHKNPHPPQLPEMSLVTWERNGPQHVRIKKFTPGGRLLADCLQLVPLAALASYVRLELKAYDTLGFPFSHQELTAVQQQIEEGKKAGAVRSLGGVPLASPPQEGRPRNDDTARVVSDERKDAAPNAGAAPAAAEQAPPAPNEDRILTVEPLERYERRRVALTFGYDEDGRLTAKRWRDGTVEAWRTDELGAGHNEDAQAISEAEWAAVVYTSANWPELASKWITCPSVAGVPIQPEPGGYKLGLFAGETKDDAFVLTWERSGPNDGFFVKRRRNGRVEAWREGAAADPFECAYRGHLPGGLPIHEHEWRCAYTLERGEVVSRWSWPGIMPGHLLPCARYEAMSEAEYIVATQPPPAPVETVTCEKCGASGPMLDEFTSPYSGLCARCEKGAPAAVLVWFYASTGELVITRQRVRPADRYVHDGYVHEAYIQGKPENIWRYGSRWTAAGARPISLGDVNHVLSAIESSGGRATYNGIPILPVEEFQTWVAENVAAKSRGSAIVGSNGAPETQETPVNPWPRRYAFGPYKQEVAGSIPAPPTNSLNRLQRNMRRIRDDVRKNVQTESPHAGQQSAGF